jgi:hypothetical protein
MTSGWKKLFSDGRVELTRRVDGEDYVIIGTRETLKIDNKERVFNGDVSLVVEDGIWKVTQTLSRNPVARFWDDEESAQETIGKMRGAVSYVVITVNQKKQNDISNRLGLNDENRTSKFPLTEPVYKQLVRAYYYYIRDYVRPIRVSPVIRNEKISFSSPESAVITHLAAMYRGDFERYVEGWRRHDKRVMKGMVTGVNIKEPAVKESAWYRYYGETPEFRWYFLGWPEEAQERKLESNRYAPEFTKEEMVSAWKKGLAGTHAEITRRLDRGDFVFIEYAIISDKDKKRRRTFSVPLQKSSGVWKLTLSQIIVHTPVFHWWNDEEAAKKHNNIVRGAIEGRFPGAVERRSPY